MTLRIFHVSLTTFDGNFFSRLFCTHEKSWKIDFYSFQHIAQGNWTISEGEVGLHILNWGKICQNYAF